MIFVFERISLILKETAMKKILLAAAVMLLFPVMFTSNEIYAQTTSVKVGNNDKNEKKEKTEEKVVVKEVEKSGPTFEQEIKRIFGMKSETSLGGSRIENLGKFFLDKYTGQVSLITYHRGEPIRWNILRDNVPDDWVRYPDEVNYQLMRYGGKEDQILLININTGAMWAIDTKGISYKNTRLKYIPAMNDEW